LILHKKTGKMGLEASFMPENGSVKSLIFVLKNAFF